MTKEEYINKLARTAGRFYLENKFLMVLPKIFGDEIIDYLEDEKPFTDNVTGKKYRADFLIETPGGDKLIIESHGFSFHAEGQVLPERFDTLNEKSNYLSSLKEYEYLQFTKGHIENKLEEIIIPSIQRAVVGLSELHNLFRFKSLKPTEIQPHKYQALALNKLKDFRNHGYKKGLCVMATGLGKTYMSALDVKAFNPGRVLFVAHLKDVLKNSLNSFHNVLGGDKKNYGLFTGEKKDLNCKYLFATVQSLSKENLEKYFDRESFDYIIVDETHHQAAESYKKFLKFFNAKFLLGMTATPDRMDNKDILKFYDTDQPIVNITRADAIKEGFLTSYCYIAKKDNVDYSNIYKDGRKYTDEDLNKKLMVEERDRLITNEYKNLEAFRSLDENQIETYKYEKHTIAFCANIDHAKYIAKTFQDNGYAAEALYSNMPKNKNPDLIKKKFNNRELEIICVVDLFNEGVDYPSVNTLLYLRPSESRTIMEQQLGRGLRTNKGKFKTMILDFVGNHQLKSGDFFGVSRGELTPPLDEKKVYWWDADGQTIMFDTEIIEDFDHYIENQKPVTAEDVEDYWVEYGEYLKSRSRDRLFATISNQQKNMDVLLLALEVKKNNPGITDDIFKDKVSEKLIQKGLSSKNDSLQAGYRGLIFPKKMGLIKKQIKLDWFHQILEKYFNDKKSNIFMSSLSDQFEKMFYFEGITGSLVNKWVKFDDRADYTSLKIYPIFALYQVLYILYKEYGENPNISKIEYEIFLLILINNKLSSIKNCVSKILDFRNLSENYYEKTQRYLNQIINNKKDDTDIDSRIWECLYLSKYLDINPTEKTVSIKSDMLDSFIKKVEDFNSLIINDKLITWEKDSPSNYKKMLYSGKDLISFHHSFNRTT